MKVFKEEQRFTQSWLIVLLAIGLIVPIILFSKEYINKEITLFQFLVNMVGILFASTLIFIFKLKTRIDEKGIHYQFFPIHFSLKTIHWSALEKVYIRKYDALSEYGGWGYKGGFFWNKNKGSAINVNGEYGIQLVYKNGKKLLIGTQLKNQAEQILLSYSSKIKSL